jgi:hypothetical protein
MTVYLRGAAVGSAVRGPLKEEHGWNDSCIENCGGGQATLTWESGPVGKGSEGARLQSLCVLDEEEEVERKTLERA